MQQEENKHIWLSLTLPPSSNEAYEINVTRVGKVNKKGKSYMGFKTSRRRSDKLMFFQMQCASYKNSNLNRVSAIRKKICEWIAQGYVVRLDTWFVFERSRIWTKDHQAQTLDADNRRKPLQDGLSNILDIDDKWFFSGNVEKVTCTSKDSECTIIRISPQRPRSLEDIHQIRNTVDSILHW